MHTRKKGTHITTHVIVDEPGAVKTVTVHIGEWNCQSGKDARRYQGVCKCKHDQCVSGDEFRLEHPKFLRNANKCIIMTGVLARSDSLFALNLSSAGVPSLHTPEFLLLSRGLRKRTGPGEMPGFGPGPAGPGACIYASMPVPVMILPCCSRRYLAI